MKKWKSLLALSLAAVLCLTGCAGGQTAQNKADEGGLPLAEWTDEPVIAQVVVNSGLGMYRDGKRLSTKGIWERLMERHTAEGLVCVGPFSGEGNALSPWIAPQHEGNVIMASSAEIDSYMIDEHYLYWLELPVETNADNNRWYLYLRERPSERFTQELAAPVCIAEGVLEAGTKAETITDFFCDWEAQDGVVLWAQPEEGTCDVVIRLYDVATGEIQELARFTADAAATRYGVQTALRENVAVWREWQVQEDGVETWLRRCDLTSGTVTEIDGAEPCEDPLIVGEQLLVRTLPEMPTDDVETVANEIWVYDLTQEKWRYRISTDLPVFEGTMHFERPLVLDDRHIALAASGAQGIYALPAVDLETGKIYKVERMPETPLYYCPRECVNALRAEREPMLYQLLPLEEGRSNNVAVQWVYSQYSATVVSIEELMYELEFHW